MELSIKISTKVNSFEILSKIEESIRVFFPSWKNNEYSENIERFPTKRVEFTLIDEIDSLEIFFQKIREQKILDTAFDVLTINLKNDKTNFSISRQSALSGKISFILGGSAGFPKLLTSKAKKILAVSKMVFPHKIARLILVEQLYRAKCIINRHPYHKA